LDLRAGTETILLAEDEDGVRNLGKQALEAVGYTVLQARDGEEALGVFRQNCDSIGLLLTDVLMPKMSGRRLAGLARAIKPGLKVLYLSGYTNDSFGQQETPETGLDILEKPFLAGDLVRRVREVLRSRDRCPTA
jgi:DNA-binding response OmpR family regulator